MSSARGRSLQPSSSTASLHLFIGVTLEFPYIPLLPVPLAAFLVTAYVVIVAPVENILWLWVVYSDCWLFGVAECWWTHCDPINRTRVSATVSNYRSRSSIWDAGLRLSVHWHNFLGWIKFAQKQITKFLHCISGSLSEGAFLWLRCGAPQVPIPARNEQ